jgi:methyl-accepting chemotaxis protein
VTLPKLSITSKLYAIFAVMAMITLALSFVAVHKARNHARLTAQFESANIGTWNVERMIGFLYAVQSAARGAVMSPDYNAAKPYLADLGKANDAIDAVFINWQRGIGADDENLFRQFSIRLSAFQNFAPELARIAQESGPQAARDWADKNFPSDAHNALLHDLDALRNHYKRQAQQTYKEVDRNIHNTALLLSLLAGLAVLMAVFGAWIIWRGVVKPIGDITRVTEAVAAGDPDLTVPFGERRDEIGALARSIAVFQRAMQDVRDLSGKVAADAEAQSQSQARTSDEVARFSAEVEATLVELGRISDQMLAASSTLAGVADDASAKTARAVAASADASNNVRDISSAADELSASVSEIDRQVAQSTDIAAKAVSEASRTNLTVKELHEAAARIGDVVRLITDIAEQTNLLALNATIEAARAGEAGRGFAVVAGEVKALAGQTGRATEEIAAQIAGMQRATARSIEAIAAIEAIIREIGDISSAIAAAVTEQGAATAEIARSVETAARRTNDTASEVTLVGSATHETRASAGTVKAVADDLGQVAFRIRAQVDQFFERLSA